MLLEGWVAARRGELGVRVRNCNNVNYMSRSQATVRFFVAGAVEAKHREPFQSFMMIDFLCIDKVSPKYMIHVYCNTLLGKV
jgi:hypothetical protein